MKYYLLVISAFILYSCKTQNNTAVKTNDAASDTSHQNVPGKNGKNESIFALTDTFQTQDAGRFVLSSLAGKPTVVAMIFTHCTYACPRITSDMKNIAGKLKDSRDKVNFLLVSFDAERDTPPQLKKFQQQMELGPGWTLLHGSDETVRTLSVLLNVQFEKDAEGNFSHSNLITVLDKNGSIQLQKEGLEADHAETIARIRELITQ